MAQLPTAQNILVVGGGLGGLCLGNALALVNANLKISIFEEKNNYSSAFPRSFVLSASGFHKLASIGFEDSIAVLGHPLLNQVISNRSGLMKELEFEDGYLGLRCSGCSAACVVRMHVFEL